MATQASTGPADEIAAERANALRTAKYGLIGALAGALIGGVGSFLGAYLTYRAQTQTHTQDVKSAAYARLATEAQNYRADLREYINAVVARDQKAYSKERTKLIQIGNDVSSAANTVFIVSNNGRVVSAATNLSNLFFAKEPPATEPVKVGEVNIQPLRRIAKRANGALGTYLIAARADLQ